LLIVADYSRTVELGSGGSLTLTAQNINPFDFGPLDRQFVDALIDLIEDYQAELRTAGIPTPDEAKP
jgi:hypothetical protein